MNWNKGISSFLIRTINLSKQEDILVNKITSLFESSLDQKKKKKFRVEKETEDTLIPIYILSSE